MTPEGPGAADPGGLPESGPVPPETGLREVPEEERSGRRAERHLKMPTWRLPASIPPVEPGANRRRKEGKRQPADSPDVPPRWASTLSASVSENPGIPAISSVLALWTARREPNRRSSERWRFGPIPGIVASSVRMVRRFLSFRL